VTCICGDRTPRAWQPLIMQPMSPQDFAPQPTADATTQLHDRDQQLAEAVQQLEAARSEIAALHEENARKERLQEGLQAEAADLQQQVRACACTIRMCHTHEGVLGVCRTCTSRGRTPVCQMVVAAAISLAHPVSVCSARCEQLLTHSAQSHL
jgi:hypothetical protein